MKDTHGRTIDYLRVSLTDRCNLRCVYCMPAEGIQQVDHDQILRYDEILAIVRVAADLGVRRIRLTGGEPLVRKGVVGLIANIRAISGIEDIALTTNGVLLARMAHDLKEAGLSRVNISLDTLDPDKFAEVTRGGNVQDVLDGIDAALEQGFDPVKVNAVAVRSLDQDFYEFASMSRDRPLHMRFIEYMPVGDSAGMNGAGWGPQDVVSCDDIRMQVDAGAIAAGLEALQPLQDEEKPEGGGPARYWKFPGAKGTVGFISPLSNHFCSACNRVRLTSKGGLRPCLFSDEEYPVRQAVRYGTEEDVRKVLEQTIGAKPEEHHEGDHARATATNMNAIGG